MRSLGNCSTIGWLETLGQNGSVRPGSALDGIGSCVAAAELLGVSLITADRRLSRAPGSDVQWS